MAMALTMGLFGDSMELGAFKRVLWEIVGRRISSKQHPNTSHDPKAAPRQPLRQRSPVPGAGFMSTQALLFMGLGMIRV